MYLKNGNNQNIWVAEFVLKLRGDDRHGYILTATLSQLWQVGDLLFI